MSRHRSIAICARPLPCRNTPSPGSPTRAGLRSPLLDGLLTQFGCQFREARRVRLAEKRRDLLLSLASGSAGSELEGAFGEGGERNARGQSVYCSCDDPQGSVIG